jgi:integrase
MRRRGVYGPTKHRRRWRIVLVDGGAQLYRSFASEEEARRFKRAALKELATDEELTVQGAIDTYQVHQRDVKRNRAKSYQATTWRLETFFSPSLDNRVGSLTPHRCAALYEALTTRASPTKKQLYSVDSHRNMLAEARTFLGWCVSRGWLRANPLAGVKGSGARHHGKAQLRIDEARTWTATALELARKGEAGAIAALLSLFMGLRASEIVSRVVRDLDDGGALLWIPASKTKAGRRTLEVPAVLRPLLVELARDKLPEVPLFGGPHWRSWVRAWVRRICARAKVPPVCAHAMRGLHATLALAAGTSPHVVAASLGHESISTTLDSYADPSALAAARARAAITVLDGGKL